MSDEQVAPPGGAIPTQWDGAGSTPAPALPPLPHVREISGEYWTFERGRLRPATEAEAGLRQHFEHVCAERDQLRVVLGDLLHLGGPAGADVDDIRRYLDAEKAALELLAREGRATDD